MDKTLEDLGYELTIVNFSTDGTKELTYSKNKNSTTTYLQITPSYCKKYDWIVNMFGENVKNAMFSNEEVIACSNLIKSDKQLQKKEV